MAHLFFDHINKIYPNGVQAVFDFQLDIKDQEFIVLVGPSGCGKSTVLRMIAGLESISSGELRINDVRVNEKPPVDRDVAMIFQDYALYGNMTVYENMGFSLTVRKRSSNEIFTRVSDVADIVGLENELNRYPANLSGGQRQRVALGRSIVRDAGVFLMDEPLSNLDAKLRSSTRREIALLHHRLKPTVVYVTHDQIEAMTMATRIVVMNHGRIQQVGTPREVYQTPANLFVATFIGSPAMNLIKGVITNGSFVSPSLSLALTEDQMSYLKEGRRVVLGIRPEDLTRVDHLAKPEALPRFPAVIDYSELLGSSATLCFEVDGAKCTALVPGDHYLQSGHQVIFEVAIEHAHFFDETTEQRIGRCPQ